VLRLLRRVRPFATDAGWTVVRRSASAGAARTGGRFGIVVRRVASVGAACAAVLLVGVACGVLVRTLAAPDEPAPPVATRVVRAGHVRVEVPRDWQLLHTGSEAVVLAPSPPLPDRVLVTLEPADSASLVGRSVRTRISTLPHRPRATKIAGLAAWQYADLVDRRGTQGIDVTVLPARDGVVNVACVSPIGEVGAMPDCAAAIRSISLGRSPALVPVPDLALQLQLPRVLTRLNRARLEGRSALAAAHRRSNQRAVARRLADAHTRAADALQPVAGGAGAPLLRELSASAAAYRALARAIAGRSAARLRAARQAVQADDARLADIVDAVVRHKLPVSTAAPRPQPPAAAPTTAGWRWPFIVLAPALALLLALCALRWRQPFRRPAPAPRSPAPAPRRPDPLRPPIGPRPASARWDAAPASVNEDWPAADARR
jgi:hypothetical protein